MRRLINQIVTYCNFYKHAPHSHCNMNINEEIDGTEKTIFLSAYSAKGGDL